MNRTSISGLFKQLSRRALIGSPLLALLLLATIMSPAPAQAQNSDYWKSAAIIGGSTAAGAYIGHRVAGTKGTLIGAAVGGAAGYAIDRRRRQAEYNNSYYGDNGPYNNGPYNNGGYYGNNYPPDPNGGYYPGPNNYPPPSGYPGYLRSNRSHR